MYFVAFGRITISLYVCMCRVHSMLGLLASFNTANWATVWADGRCVCTQAMVKGSQDILIGMDYGNKYFLA